jgi:hypothetical protein
MGRSKAGTALRTGRRVLARYGGVSGSASADAVKPSPRRFELALRWIASVTTRSARLFIDGGDPLRELAIPRS